MDAFFLTKSLEREKYSNVPREPKGPKGPKGPMPQMGFLAKMQFILSVTISLYAAYLAWKTGSSDSAFFRILTTLLAFMFSTLYIIGYVIVKGFKALV